MVADGGRARSSGHVLTTPEDLRLFAESLALDARMFADLLGRRPDPQGLRWAMSAPAPCVDWSRVVEACLKRRTQVKNEISAVLQRNR